MIYLNLTGRLGNQMFQYAFARKLHIERKCIDGFCFSFKDILARKDEGKGFEDTLQFFNVLPYKTCNKNLIREFGTPYQIFLYGLYKLKKGIISDCRFRKNGIFLSSYCNNNNSHCYQFVVSIKRNREFMQHKLEAVKLTLVSSSNSRTGSSSITSIIFMLHLPDYDVPNLHNK